MLRRMSRKRTRGSGERFEDDYGRLRGPRNFSLIMESLGSKDAEMKGNLPATVLNSQDAKDGKINEETDDYSDSEDQYDTKMDNDLSSLNDINGMEKPGKFF